MPGFEGFARGLVAFDGRDRNGFIGEGKVGLVKFTGGGGTNVHGTGRAVALNIRGRCATWVSHPFVIHILLFCLLTIRNYIFSSFSESCLIQEGKSKATFCPDGHIPLTVLASVSRTSSTTRTRSWVHPHCASAWSSAWSCCPCSDCTRTLRPWRGRCRSPAES